MKTILIDSPNCRFISSASPFSNAGGSGSFLAGEVAVAAGLLAIGAGFAAGVGGVEGFAGGFVVAPEVVEGGLDGEAVVVGFLGSSLLLVLLLMLLYL
jgi:hypothetical protein